MSAQFRIGYVGLGNIGTEICTNLGKYAAKEGLPPLTIWNRSQEKYKSLSTEALPGVHLAKSLEEVTERSNLIFGCLLNDKVAEEVFGALFKSASKGEEVIFVDQSSLNPKTSAKLEQQAKEAGVVYLTCPIFGAPPAAKAASLILVVSGDELAREKIKPVIKPAIGRYIIDVGDDVKKAAALKLLGNMTIMGTIQVLAETFAMADNIDFDPSILLEYVHQMYPSPPWIGYSTKIANGAFAGGTGFRVGGGLKDAGHIMTLGEDFGHPFTSPIIERAVANLRRAEQIGGSEMDWSSLSIAERERAGLAPFRPGSEMEGKEKQ